MLDVSRYLPHSQVQWLREWKEAINPALFCTSFWGQLKSPPISIKQLAAVSRHKQQSYSSPALCMSSAGITGPQLSSESGRFFMRFPQIGSTFTFSSSSLLIRLHPPSSQTDRSFIDLPINSSKRAEPAHWGFDESAVPREAFLPSFWKWRLRHVCPKDLSNIKGMCQPPIRH